VCQVEGQAGFAAAAGARAGIFSGSCRSKYRLGAANGRCGLKKPTAKNHGSDDAEAHVVGVGEPEDALLVRDFRWVVDLANKLGADIARLTQERDEVSNLLVDVYDAFDSATFDPNDELLTPAQAVVMRKVRPAVKNILAQRRK
jgi:hypothetical protein